MPRAIFKVQGAPNKTRWTLAQKDEQKDLHSPVQDKEERENVIYATTMQSNGAYYDRTVSPLPRYESFDGSQYSVPGFEQPPSNNNMAWRPPTAVQQQHQQYHGQGKGHFEDFEYNTPLEERASHQISLNTRIRSQNEDVVGQHLLYEKAMMDSESYEMLEISDVDALKKEHARLNSRIDAAHRKLALENKVKEAAQNLQRLYSASGKGRPDTPQSPDSPKRSRSSLLGRVRPGSSSGGSGSLTQAEDELAVSTKKVEELTGTLKLLFERRQFVERKLLRHTAAVLAEQSARATKQINGKALTNGHAQHYEEPDSHDIYHPDEFDGIRDILHGAPATSASRGGAQKLQEEQEQHMASVQTRLEHLNEQLRLVIGEASRVRGVNTAPEPAIQDHDQEPTARLDQRLNRLEDNVHLLEQEQQGVKAHYARLQDSAHMTRNAVEEQLSDINHQLHNTLLLSADMQNMESLREPPQASGHGYQQQLQYLADSLGSMEQTLRQHRLEFEDAREASEGHEMALADAQGKAHEHAKKVDDYEATLGGLWEILQSDRASSRAPSGIDQDAGERGLPSPTTPLREDFSLGAFSSHVQHLYNQQQSAKEQQAILKRQIQQQRELNGKSDAEKDMQLTDLQGRHDHLANEHGGMQEQLTKEMAQRSQAESEVAEARLELMNTANEFEGLKKMVDARQQEWDEMQRQLQTHHQNAVGLQQHVESLEAQVAGLTDDARLQGVEHDSRARDLESMHATTSEQLAAAVAEREAAEHRHASVQDEMQELEGEVVRLTTELTMAKAELEGAYGSRAERAREAQAAEVVGLGQQNKAMTEQLQQLHTEHTGLKETHAAAVAQLEGMKTGSVSVERAKNLESELRDMTDAFRDLTKESVELEKERGQLEDLIDGLRDRCEGLEAQVHDEKVRWMGVRSPMSGAVDAARDGGVNGRGNGAAVVGGGVGGREMKSMMVIRQEFKKMMREARAEGVRLLRAEQDQRRQVEAELRRLRQANGPLAKALPTPASATPAQDPPQVLEQAAVHGHSNGAMNGTG
ncbi:hypothetical protein LTR78_004162 [Recurvomyces mirabilis]|uniref:Up-regulated during septation protein 1 domain-containing protein n=1 Tax=Recurvomyces mirabilis TaxID=574656 RepID=A0AAE1C2R3_9PEZI|nr:hypothetical protein LTR78_004162 [Recurvomyces mirabilis]KAK5153667.1 hypothetical protein LTS14_007361 [Recurvomyces mirabilis]